MRTILSFLTRVLKLLMILAFGILPAYASLTFAGLLFERWAKHSEPMSFQLIGSFAIEAQMILAVSGYALFVNLARFLEVRLNQRLGKVFPNEYSVASTCYAWFVYITAAAYGLFFAIWGIFALKADATNYWLLGSFFMLMLGSLMIALDNWDYGIPARARTRTSIAGPVQNERDADEAPPVARRERPTVTFASILGNKDIKRRLHEAATAITAAKGSGKANRNGILLHGEPGNGKTIFAEALAGELKLPILKLTHSDVASRWVGERTEKIKAAFDQAIRAQPCVFFIDEIDSFIPDRSGASTQTKEDTDVVNSLLTLLVDVRKHKVVVVAATNYMDRLDGAAVREGRFDFKVEITPPDEEARIGLLTSGLGINLRGVPVDLQTIRDVAQRWNGFSVKRILAVTEELPSYLAELKESGKRKTSLEYDDFMAALRRIQGRRGAAPENVKPLADLILPAVTKEALDMLSSRLRDPQRVERLGGTLPVGVLFYGPPGTGKTAACKALAKEVDWAFLIATGTDLARDPKGLDKLYAQAKELRPCIVFIDEADDLVRSREFSSSTEATNKLLTIMDGVNDRVRDVVWIAATNHPDQMDSALLRGGRFTEKVEFARPNESQLAGHVESWLKARKIHLAPGLMARDIADLVGDQSIANLEAVLQYAVNRAISTSTRDDALVLTKEDLRRGVSSVLGAS
jgi:transitional endoplasmic reticulum ATPase